MCAEVVHCDVSIEARVGRNAVNMESVPEAACQVKAGLLMTVEAAESCQREGCHRQHNRGEIMGKVHMQPDGPVPCALCG